MNNTPQSSENKPQENNSNPLMKSIVARVNALNNRTYSNRIYGGTHNHTNPIINQSTDYQEIIRLSAEIIKNKQNVQELFYSFHNLLSNKMGCCFSGYGLLRETSKCINIKLIDKIGGTYSSRVLLNEDANPIVIAFNERTPITKSDIKFLNNPYLKDCGVLILPLTAFDNCLGVMLIGDSYTSNFTPFYSLLASYLSLFIHNRQLVETVSQNTGIDSLTGLVNHRGFQEELSRQIQKAEKLSDPMSVVILDIANISQINREMGHAKGDEVIKIVGDKVKQNIRNTDFAGRYGGDEIGIILPKTDVAEAKYLAEYITYSLSCCLVDGVGPIKASVGIATYPESSKNQEKLLILAEQAMYISKSKGYQKGTSAIVSSQDFDFWDDMALNSFAEVLTKRHAQIGINFEEELVQKFHNEKISSSNHLIDVVTSLAGAIDAKDSYTKGHSTSVSRYSEALARAINLPEAEVARIKLGALLHDVGKIGIPENVLRKPTMLTDEEWEIMKQHPVIGAQKVLEPNEALHDLIPIVKYHHEHWDGSGYPYGLKGDEIPFTARIVAIADAYHALISDRPYRKGMSVEKACEILRLGAGIQWEKELVRQFIAIAPSLATEV